MTKDTPTSHARLPKDRGPMPEPVETKRCRSCRQSLPLDKFDRRRKGGKGVAATCRPCLDIRYETGTFCCSRCLRTLAGSAFYRGGAGSAIAQPCKECLSAAQEVRTRLRRAAQGRPAYHLLSDIDEDKRTATCRECGPTHIYATGSKQGKGWRCGKRSDEMSADWYDRKAEIVGKHASRNWHKLRNVRGAEMRGTCSLCGDVPVRWQQKGGYFVCAGPRRKRRDADAERNRRRLKLYGLTMDDYERMNEEQGGRCAICGGTRVRSDSDGKLVVDHDHATGAVRALLCSPCNSGLGHFVDDPTLLLAAIEYLKKHARPEVHAA